MAITILPKKVYRKGREGCKGKMCCNLYERAGWVFGLGMAGLDITKPSTG
jgi:hypothetical protein